jgi:hypothetical protein
MTPPDFEAELAGEANPMARTSAIGQTILFMIGSPERLLRYYLMSFGSVKEKSAKKMQ